MKAPITIQFGPEHGPALRALKGEGARNIANCIYLTPRYEVFQRTDGTVIQVIERASSSLVYEFANRGEWHDAENARWATYPDPETGRVRVR